MSLLRPDADPVTVETADLSAVQPAAALRGRQRPLPGDLRGPLQDLARGRRSRPGQPRLGGRPTRGTGGARQHRVRVRRVGRSRLDEQLPARLPRRLLRRHRADHGHPGRRLPAVPGQPGRGGAQRRGHRGHLAGPGARQGQGRQLALGGPAEREPLQAQADHRRDPRPGEPSAGAAGRRPRRPSRALDGAAGGRPQRPRPRRRHHQHLQDAVRQRPGAEVKIVGGGTRLQVAVPADAEGIATFRYYVTDGKVNDERYAQVRLTIRKDGQHSKPKADARPQASA
ncbi:hypothetical protein G5V59_07865 [Nocardioides sp. W3-2-3]|uniref:hypothetical protein n=1 Tax=Nocardioides convexus TaxID=2712224 RepID=UPI002418818E|nr:hypothetical protein [Nocardioides convexus]NHA00111.1 hypothetical protein [Nocardioides convexus]